MEAQLPSPQTTLLILLGASAWPLFPEFQSSEAFANAARGLKAYFLDPKRFGLSPENVLDVFNSNHSPDELDVEIGQFLERRLTALKGTGHAARDLLVYFVGHVGFIGRDSDFYLAIRRTRTENPRASGIPVLSLADTITEKARYLRRIIILDCCFAAAAFSAFQTGPSQVAIEKAVDAFEVRQRRAGFPAKGTTLLCSSSHKSPSLLLPDGSSTMFTKAVLDALSKGMPLQREHISLREVKDLAASFLSETRNAPRPVVLSPDQSEGDVADIPFFPNPRAEEERARQAEEARRRLAEEAERTRRMEEERQRRIEEEQARQIEEKRVRKAREEEQTPSYVPYPASSGILQDLRSRQLSWRKAGLPLVLALLILGSAGGLFAAQHLSTARTQTTATAAQVQSTARAAADAYARFVATNGIMFGFDAQHSHANPYEQILNPTTVGGLTKKWAYDSGNSIVSGFYSSPAVAGGVVYVGSGDGSVYALDAASGTKKWASTTGSSFVSSPAVAGGVVYVGSDDGNVYALDAASGAKKWASPTGTSIVSSPAVANGAVYVGSGNGNVYALDAASGAKKWVYHAAGSITSSPAVAGGVVYIRSDDGNLYALDAVSGMKKWVYHTVGVTTFSPIISSPAVAGGVVYIGSDDRKVYALDAITGVKKWAYPTGNVIYSSPTVAGGVVYIGSEDHKVYALDAVTGVKKWTYDTGWVIDSSPAVANGVVYIGTGNGNVYAFHLPGTS